jgi:hypothetical protein
MNYCNLPRFWLEQMNKSPWLIDSVPMIYGHSYRDPVVTTLGVDWSSRPHGERIRWHLDPNSLEARSMNSSFFPSMVNKKHRWLGSGPRGPNLGWCQGFPAISMGRKRQSKFQLSPLGLKEWRHFPHIATWWLVTCFIPPITCKQSYVFMFTCRPFPYLLNICTSIYIYCIYIYIYIILQQRIYIHMETMKMKRCGHLELQSYVFRQCRSFETKNVYIHTHDHVAVAENHVYPKWPTCQ